MGLLAPLFLLGLVAVVAPILVHLVHRERNEPVPFPSLMFLRRVPIKSSRRQRIRYWLLFLTRLAALLLIVLAFARPWIKSPAHAAAVAKSSRDIVLLIDRSYSMSARGVWERARKGALEVIGSARPDDRVTVIVFGEHAELLARAEDGAGRAAAAVRNLQPGTEVTRYAPALRLAASVLSHAQGNTEIVWVTDRQRSGWRATEQAEVPPGTTTRVIDVRAASLSNVRVTGAQLVGKRGQPAARIDNQSDRAQTLTAQLRLDGRLQQVRNVNVGAHASATVTFDPIPAGSKTGDIRINASDDIATDNIAYFSAAGNQALLVRIVSPDPAASYYFERALGAGDAGVFTMARAATFAAADLRDAAVIAFVQTAVPGGSASGPLRDFVSNGGGVIAIAPRLRADNSMVPVSGLRGVERADNSGTLVITDARHPLFAPFTSAGSDPFGDAHLRSDLRAEPAEGATVLARFDDGTAALVEQRIGRGRVLYMATPFDRTAGDLVLQPGFAPFVQQLVQYAAADAHAQRAFLVGNFVTLDGKVTQLTHPGVYPPDYVANVDPEEADYTPADVSLFDNAIIPIRDSTTPTPTPTPTHDHDHDHDHDHLWWYLLATAFAFLAADTLLGNFISSRQVRSA